MKDRRIGLDMDGVIIDHTQTIIGQAERLGVKLSPEQTEIVALKDTLSETDLEMIYEYIYESPRAADTSILMSGVNEALERIVSSGAEIYILSRRTSASVAIELLTKVGLWNKYFTDGNTFFVERSSEKAAIAERLDLTDYIDDQPSALIGAMKDVPGRYFFDQYDLLKDSTDFVRVKSWADFADKLGYK